MANKDQYFETEEFKANLRSYEEALQAGRSVYFDSDIFADIAEYYQSRGQKEQAAEAIERAIRLFPGATLPWVFKAREALMAENGVEEAYECLQHVDDTSDFEYIYMLAEIMIVEDKIEQADAVLQACFDTLDDDERNDFLVDAATLYADYEVFDKALQWFEQINGGEDSEYKELKGRISLGHGNYEESENIFQELLEEDPYSSHYWNNLASLQFLKNDFANAITSSEFSIAINPDDSEAILNKGNSLFSLGNYDEALKYFRRYAELVPDDATGEMLKGVTLLHLNRTDEALARFKAAERKCGTASANLPEIYQEMAFTYSRLGQMEKALAYVDKRSALKYDYPAETLLLKGHILLENDDVESAQEAFQEAVRLSDNSPEIFLQIAISVYDCGYLQLAYKLLLSYFEGVNNDTDDGYSYLAICCKELGKTDEYMQAVKKACEKNPAEARMVLADLFPQEMDPADYYAYLLSNGA